VLGPFLWAQPAIEKAAGISALRLAGFRELNVYKMYPSPVRKAKSTPGLM
jgi:hypothetical protein